ncbi:MAG TPA: shikimate dehydrogenase [Gemmatimonadaceae bacterium]|nr:shikimate dehydrogenase [Gemmatimonadaceae bacterium]
MKRAPTRLVLLGNPVSGSLSPIFQRAALDAAGIDIAYDALDITPAQLAATIAGIRASNVAGNVTRPHKVAFREACDELTPIADRVGAVNTFWMENETLIGDNTDVDGFDLAARDLLEGEIAGREIMLLGAGGGASAVLAAVERWPRVRVAILSRNGERASALARRYVDVARVETNSGRGAAGATLIVNATPLGQYDDQFPIDLAAIPRGAALFDLVYRREETAWIRAGREKGHRAVDGLPMLLEQGALGFQRWFGKPADRKAMRQSLV